MSEDGDSLSANRIVPIYPLTEGIRQNRLRRMVDTVLQAYLPLIEESLPADIVCSTNYRGAVGFAEHSFSRKRRTFAAGPPPPDFRGILSAANPAGPAATGQQSPDAGISFAINETKLRNDLRQIVPFELTGAQKAGDWRNSAGRDERQLMKPAFAGRRGQRQNDGRTRRDADGNRKRLSGGTHGPDGNTRRAARDCSAAFAGTDGLAVELSLGSQTEKMKREVRERLLGGQSRLVVGTHALIQEGVDFAKLGMVIIDEQHRFGVLPAAGSGEKGRRPHVLVMTATPIPRTLTLTLYGDLDVSIPGRTPSGTQANSDALENAGQTQPGVCRRAKTAE